MLQLGEKTLKPLHRREKLVRQVLPDHFPVISFFLAGYVHGFFMGRIFTGLSRRLKYQHYAAKGERQ